MGNTDNLYSEKELTKIWEKHIEDWLKTDIGCAVIPVRGNITLEADPKTHSTEQLRRQLDGFLYGKSGGSNTHTDKRTMKKDGW